MNKKNTPKINWDEVDAVPESEYNYIDSPEITADMFKKMTIMFPDDKKKININPIFYPIKVLNILQRI